MKTLLTVALLLVTGAVADVSMASAEQYLCTAEQASGFLFDERSKAWNHTQFRAGNKYLIAAAEQPGPAFQVTKMGDSYSLADCKETFNERGYLFCRGYREFKFNKKNGRFLSVFAHGYYNVLPGGTTDEDSDTPYIEIGRCSPF